MTMPYSMYPQCQRCGNVATPNHQCLRPIRSNDECPSASCRALDVTCADRNRCPL